MRILWTRKRIFLFGFGRFLLASLMAMILVGTTVAPASTAPGDIKVSVFNQSGLNGSGSGCDVENANLIAIINALSGYEVDGAITDFVDRAGETTLASQLAASRFFFMTDMENQNPSSSSFLPDSAKTAIRNWTNSGGVMVMTGTAGTYDVDFLNTIYSWNLVNQAHGTATEVTANTIRTPFANATNGVSLTQSNATNSISSGTVANYKSMWQTSAGYSEVAVIQYGAGTVIYLGWDFYASGPSCGYANDPWVQKIIPAALKYASELSQSGLDNATTTGGDLKYTFSQNGDAYYVIVPAASLAPTNAQIKAMVDYGTTTVSRSGTAPITANVERVFNVTGLTPATDYKAYIVTDYVNSGSQAYSSQQVVEFSTKPGVPTVVSVNADNGKIIADLTPYGTETNFEYSTDAGTSWVARSPASTSTNWEITGLTNGTTYTVQFRSAYRALRGDSTSSHTATPAAQPASLTTLTSSVGTLSPTFSANTLNYTVNVENNTSSITFTPTSTGNTITVSGRPCTSGQASSSIALEVGTQPVTISVTRAGVVNPTVYTVQVTRAGASQGSSYSPPYSPPVVIKDQPSEIKVLKSKDGSKSVLKVELPESGKRNSTTKYMVKLFDTAGSLIRQIEVPTSADAKTAEIEVSLPFGYFDASVATITAAGLVMQNYAPGNLVYKQTLTRSLRNKLILSGQKVVSSIKFDPDSSKVTDVSVSQIKKLIASKAGQPGRFMITGFVREAGASEATEQKLATARARNVAIAFTKAGSNHWIQYFGFGTTGSGNGIGNSRSVEIRWVPTK